MNCHLSIKIKTNCKNFASKFSNDYFLGGSFKILLLSHSQSQIPIVNLENLEFNLTKNNVDEKVVADNDCYQQIIRYLKVSTW